MRTFAIVVGSWLLFNVLFVLSVTPRRKGKMPVAMIKALDAIKRLLRNHRNN